jgi:hypothetical protein
MQTRLSAPESNPQTPRELPVLAAHQKLPFAAPLLIISDDDDDVKEDEDVPGSSAPRKSKHRRQKQNTNLLSLSLAIDIDDNGEDDQPALPHEMKEGSIPSTLHKIWFGKPIPREYMKSLAQSGSPGYKVKLWTDKPEAVRRQMFVCDIPLESAPFEIEHLTESRLDGMLESAELGDMELKDGTIPYAKVLGKFVRMELNGEGRNYAAFSDIARALILYHEGGTYADTDIDPTRRSINRDLNGKTRDSTTNRYHSGLALKGDGSGRWNNCLMAAAPRAGALKDVLKIMAERLENTDPNSMSKKRVGAWRRDLTLSLTGPGAYYHGIRRYLAAQRSSEEPSVVDAEGFEYRCDNTWLPKKRPRSSSLP